MIGVGARDRQDLLFDLPPQQPAVGEAHEALAVLLVPVSGIDEIERGAGTLGAGMVDLVAQPRHGPHHLGVRGAAVRWRFGAVQPFALGIEIGEQLHLGAEGPKQHRPANRIVVRVAQGHQAGPRGTVAPHHQHEALHGRRWSSSGR